MNVTPALMPKRKPNLAATVPCSHPEKCRFETASDARAFLERLASRPAEERTPIIPTEYYACIDHFHLRSASVKERTGVYGTLYDRDTKTYS